MAFCVLGLLVWWAREEAWLGELAWLGTFVSLCCVVCEEELRGVGWRCLYDVIR